MKKQLHITGLLLLFTLSVFSQEEAPVKNWTRSGTATLNFSQSHLSNWAAGGENALNTSGRIIYQTNYARNKAKWNNNIDLGLGYSILGDNKAIKTDDKIELNSMYGVKASDRLFYSLSFSFKSQFTDGFDYKKDSSTPISKFFAPAYITLGLGLDWAASKHFEMNLSPATARITMVNDQRLADLGSFGVEGAKYDTAGLKLKDGKRSRFEFGGKFTAKLNVDLAKNINFTSKLELFTDYLKNIKNVDVDWQNLLTMKVNSWLNANITLHLIYDDDIKITDKDGNSGPRTQFKEVISVGLSYTL
ncbi:MAG: DUF3078 domain-containing protein [Bacteroidales bacterium]|nr:DUF3078 domain-containing protein [Bacteroidales bacterium]